MKNGRYISNHGVFFYKNGMRHREGGKPAVIYRQCGTQFFYQNGQLVKVVVKNDIERGLKNENFQ